MITTELYDGQGLGNQLWAYAVARIVADKKKLPFSIAGKDRFKGKDFMSLDFGVANPVILQTYTEKKKVLKGTTTDISGTDLDLFKVAANTKIEGCFQSAKYLDGYRDKIREWITLKPDYSSKKLDDNTCIIHMRCGDFIGAQDVFLPKEYYLHAMEYIRKINPAVKFYCVTDQADIARKILPEVEIVGSALGNKSDSHKASHHHGGPIGEDFGLIMQARYVIIPNSSFSWWAAYLNTRAEIIVAPKYWARHKVSNGYWSTADIITDSFTYLDRKGVAFSSDQCWREKVAYDAQSPFPAFIENALQKLGLRKNSAIPHKKFDCFIFYNELDLLEMRLNILNDVVDYFVLVEATKTFTGIPKPLFYEDNKARFKDFNHKIIHIVVDSMPDSFKELEERLPFADTLDKKIITDCLTSPNVPKDQIQWLREFYQKEQMKKGLVNAQDTDTCYISDLDEIWNPKVQFRYNPRKIYRFKQTVYTYFLNNRSSEEWYGSRMCTYKKVREESINHLRTPNRYPFVTIENGGWHFTFQGGAQAVKEKLAAYSHQEYNTQSITSNIEKSIQSKSDFIGRKFEMKIDETGLPEYIINNKDKYKKYFV